MTQSLFLLLVAIGMCGLTVVLAKYANPDTPVGAMCGILSVIAGCITAILVLAVVFTYTQQLPGIKVIG